MGQTCAHAAWLSVRCIVLIWKMSIPVSSIRAYPICVSGTSGVFRQFSQVFYLTYPICVSSTCRVLHVFHLENVDSSQLDPSIPHLCVWHVWCVQTVLTGVHPKFPNIPHLC